MAELRHKQPSKLLFKKFEAERARAVDTYGDRVGEMVSGIVKRTERNGIIVDLGKNA